MGEGRRGVQSGPGPAAGSFRVLQDEGLEVPPWGRCGAGAPVLGRRGGSARADVGAGLCARGFWPSDLSRQEGAPP